MASTEPSLVEGSPRPVTLLSVRDLKVSFGAAEAVCGVDLELSAGEIVGLVGESGCGKSLTCRALLGLAPRAATVTGSLKVLCEPIDLNDKDGLARIRGRRAAMVFQDPMSALDPLMTVAGQLNSRIAVHGTGASPAALLNQVGFRGTTRILAAYPHQLSGGQCQRVAIALALAGEPALLIADEATTALDVTVQARVLDLFDRLRLEQGLAVLLVTHDLDVVSDICDKVAVMYAGEIVEMGPSSILDAPRHPYTAGLIASRPRLSGPRHSLRPIEGRAPRPGEVAHGCRFRPRCAHAQPLCASPPPRQSGALCHAPLNAPT